MLSRRDFTFSVLAGIAAPAVSLAQGQGAGAIRAALPGLTQLHAILVQRGGDLVLVEAPRGPGLRRPANIKSCSKSILALLLGEAMARGAVPGLQTRLADLAPDLVPANATQGAGDLTLEDMVTLRGGLESTSGGNYGSWVSSANWVAYALRQPRVSPNGGRMIYSTGTTHVLGAALSRATGRSLLDLARASLGQGLGIDIPPWTRDPQGFYFGGNEMAMSPEAMLRVAVMMRDGGRFQGRQVIPQDWVRASQQPRTVSPYSGLAYGYGWFISETGWILARGYGGQIIAANPRRDLAVAITSDPTRPARSGGYFGDLMRLLDGPVLGLA
ncbi:CubicO group peptidase, beta-lactamase class C family [Paracoccus isoporae]|uniref:CubicO group peptidase, beta-lactamase class C family n=1 Tax=Paracoccus isoporae TaxID=591205 RepID=A0A1G7DA12_9RHOB|nr:serine hydrolase [Paracoccus isoporae]SDE48397.1 CubicO group peptidase, beta-lactamase class C family [Paracoccus isoporae]